jgi:hypothetical protein
MSALSEDVKTRVRFNALVTVEVSYVCAKGLFIRTLLD